MSLPILKRVVVTGIGIVSPLGIGKKIAWENLLNGYSGVVQLTDKEYEKLPCNIAALVPKGDAPGQLNLEKHFSNSDLRSMAPATGFALIATEEALQDAKWFPQDDKSLNNTGVSIGMGMVDIDHVYKTGELLKSSYKKISPFFVPRILTNMAAGQVSIRYGFRGPNHAVSTACATGVHAIGDAYRFIQYGDADIMVCGATEACICPLSIAAFCRLRALSTSFNDDPKKASRPFDEKREGFVMGEGAAILIIESLEHALSRKANIYAEILGYGLSGDASHLTAPREDSAGAIRAMERAIQTARLDPTHITYINAHATSTPLGDALEVKAIQNLFQKHCDNLQVSSTKGAHGHLLGAAGNLEAAFSVLSCYYGWLPPTLNMESIAENMKLNFVANIKNKWVCSNNMKRVVLKNAFGFGGTNASICFSEFVL